MTLCPIGRRALSFALVLSATLVGCGGGTCMNGEITDDVVTGSVRADGSPPMTSSVVLVAAGGDMCSGSAPCVEVMLGDSETVMLRWTLPSSPGTYTLTELGAELCEQGSTRSCAPLAGGFVVDSVTRPCGDTTCGALEADVELAPLARDSGVASSGKLHLSYLASATMGGCGSSTPLFGLD